MLVGIDPHADQVTVAVTDDRGTPAGSLVAPNTAVGWAMVIREVGTAHRWMVENAHGWGYGIARYLSGRGGEVYDVAPWMTAQLRSGRPHANKTDPGDAGLIALAGVVFGPPPFVSLPNIDQLRHLVTTRRLLVKTRTQFANQLKATLRTICPDQVNSLGRLRTRTQWKHLCRAHTPNPAATTTIRTLAHLGLELTDHIHQLETTIKTLLPPVGHALTTICGIGLIGAATILTEVRHPHRFTTHAQLAAWAGTAPLDCSSGRQQTHRLNRGGNRTFTATIHRAIETQINHHGPAATYITKKQQQGTTRRAAKRACARHLTRTIHKTLTQHPWT